MPTNNDHTTPIPEKAAIEALTKLEEIHEARLRRKAGAISLLVFYHEVSAILDREGNR